MEQYPGQAIEAQAMQGEYEQEREEYIETLLEEIHRLKQVIVEYENYKEKVTTALKMMESVENNLKTY